MPEGTKRVYTHLETSDRRSLIFELPLPEAPQELRRPRFSFSVSIAKQRRLNPSTKPPLPGGIEPQLPELGEQSLVRRRPRRPVTLV